MEITRDELAGIVDMFGGLTESELHRALEDLAARTGQSYNADAWATRIAEAQDEYFLVEVPVGNDTLFVPGPVSLPSVPDLGDDLPHILDLPRREVDQTSIGFAVESRLRGDAARAVNRGDTDAAENLLDICYEIDAWGVVDTTEIRDSLNTIRES